MKTYCIALALSVMAISPVYARKDSVPADAGSIGAEQAVFDFCSRVDPSQDQSFDKQAKQLVAGLSRDAIDSLRESGAYLQGYQLLKSVLQEFSAADAVASCRAVAN